MSTPAPRYGKFGFIQTEPGVSAWHMTALMYAAFVSIALATFDAFGTPYVLSESIGVPLGEQGSIVGRLNVYTEIVFKGTDKKDRPDGLLIVEQGSKTFTALIEAKVDKAPIDADAPIAGDDLSSELISNPDMGHPPVMTLRGPLGSE